MFAQPIHLAYQNGEPVFIHPEDRNHHFFICGAIGSGKSNAMSYMAMQDLLVFNPVIFLDPHGEEYRRLLRFAVSMAGIDSRVNLFDLTSDTLTGFNPFAVKNRDPDHIAAVAGRLVDAISVIFNQTTVETPRLQRILGICFIGAIHHRLTLADIPDMLSTAQVAGNYLQMKLGDTFIEGQLGELDRLRKKNIRAYMDAVDSAYNRLTAFLKNPRLRSIFSQTENALDIGGIMERGESLLVNLSRTNEEGIVVVDEDEARLMGTLLVNEIFQAGQARPPSSKHVMVYLDEFSDFINRRVGRILQESRKRRLCLHLACQHLNQLKAFDEALFHDVVNGARNRLVFATETIEDAQFFARQNFRFDLKVVKHTLPHVVDYEVRIMKSGSTGLTVSRTDTDSWTETEGTATTEGMAFTKGTAVTKGNARTTGTADTRGMTDTLGQSLSQSQSEGRFQSASDGKSGSTSKSSFESESEGESIVDKEKGDEYRDEYLNAIYLERILTEGEYQSYLSAPRSERAEIIQDLRDTFSVLDGARIMARPSWREMVPTKSTGKGKGTSEGESNGWSHADSKGTNSSLSRGKTDSKSQALSKSKTKSQSVTQSDSVTTSESITESRSTTDSYSFSVGGSTAHGKAKTQTEGWQETMVPILEERPVQFYSKEEVEYLFGTMIQDLRVGHAVYKPIDGKASLVVFEEAIDFSHIKGDRLKERVDAIYERQGTALPAPTKEIREEVFGKPALQKHVRDEPEEW